MSRAAESAGRTGCAADGVSIQYTVKRSRRRTLSLQYKDGKLTVYAPIEVSDGTISLFVEEHRDWVLAQEKRFKAKSAAASSVRKMTPKQYEDLGRIAKKLIPEKVAACAKSAGVSGRLSGVSVRCQKTRWGSCSAKGRISINMLLLLAPSEILDSVVAHEVCHLKHMNHSGRFYKELESLFPGYRNAARWLKENGHLLYAALPEQKSAPAQKEET